MIQSLNADSVSSISTSATLRRQTVTIAYSSSKQLLLFAFALQSGRGSWAKPCVDWARANEKKCLVVFYQ